MTCCVGKDVMQNPQMALLISSAELQSNSNTGDLSALWILEHLSLAYEFSVLHVIETAKVVSKQEERKEKPKLPQSHWHHSPAKV